MTFHRKSRTTAMTRSSSCSSSNSNRHIANVANYRPEEGKMKASLKWLVSRVYGDNYVPDGLRELFFSDVDGHLQPSPPLIASLVNGSLYCLAASRIFQDAAIAAAPQHNIGAVFSALSREGIDVRDLDGNGIVEETLLQSNPFNIGAHLHMTDALMTAHLRSLVSIEKIVQAISNYTSVEKREEPLDCVDALLFWINKICLLVRDDIERNGLLGVDELPIIPEMEDLYEDLCDGTCICALISFYRSDELPLREICFNDPMTVNDCRFNLEILRKFCASFLPWNPFHFETEDILYLHESLQPNINVFLADFFQFFESHSLMPPAEPTPASLQQRRFVPIQSIPDLRTQDIAYSNKGKFGVRNSNNRPVMANTRDRASSLASEDSFGTNSTLQTKDSLTVSTPRPSNLDPNAPNVTHFAAFNAGHDPSNDPSQQQNSAQKQRTLRNTAEIRLQMEEMRRQLAQRQQIEMAKQGQRRCEAGKDAFFRVMSKSANIESPQAQSSPIVQNQPTDLLSPTNDNTLVAQFQQMPTYFGSQQNVAPNATTQYYERPQQQLWTPQQQRLIPSQTATGGPFTQQTPNAMMQTSTPQMGSFGSVSSSHPMLSPIANCTLKAHNGSSFVVDPSSLMGPASSQQHFGGGAHQFATMPHPSSIAQQRQQLTEQSQYAVPSDLHPTHQQQQHQFATISPYGVGSPSFGVGPLQSSSQPMHLHMQQIPTSFSYPQQPPLHHQSQQQFHQPFYQQNPQQFPTNHMGFQQHQLQQNYVPSPLPPPINTASMFPSAEAFQMPPPLPPHQTQLFGGAHCQLEESSTAVFRLHQANAPASRLDPQLDLNRDLTNWSQMTYRDGDRPQRKTWAQKQSETDKSIQNPNFSSPGKGGPSAGSRGRMVAQLSGGSGEGSAVNSPEKDNLLVLNQTYTKSLTDASVALLSPATVVNGSASANNRSGGSVLENVSEPNSEMTPEMQAKRRAILASQIRRKERMMAKSEEKESEDIDRLQVKMQRMEQAEMRKMERVQKRQKLLEGYKRKKMEQELLEPGSARTCASSTISLNRGHSQPPPFGRPKSQSNMNLDCAGGTLSRRLGRAQSNVGNENADNEQNGGTSTARANVPSTAEPSLKLYAKQQPKSNRGLIMNALQYSVFPGHVSNDQRQKAQAAIAQSDSKHFLVLFRDHKCQYRGLYTWDQFSDTVHKIDGLGPKICKEPMMTIMFKYDSGAKSFGHIPTKHLSVTIDGFVVADQYWQKPKIPHSGR
uniref:Patronin n=1 Tax=Globodera rostochiensis TaxID=31243 RepID=A0A914H1N0_GLORO